MGQPFNPNSFALSLPDDHRQFVQSIASNMNGNLDMGTPQGTVPTTSGFGINQGVFSQFQKGNGSGVLVRIAAAGVSGTGATYNWTTANTGVVINHGLLRQPIGFHVVDMDKTVSVFRTAAPDQNQITLAPTDASASVTVYIF